MFFVAVSMLILRCTFEKVVVSCVVMLSRPLSKHKCTTGVVVASVAESRGTTL